MFFSRQHHNYSQIRSNKEKSSRELKLEIVPLKGEILETFGRKGLDTRPKETQKSNSCLLYHMIQNKPNQGCRWSPPSVIGCILGFLPPLPQICQEPVTQGEMFKYYNKYYKFLCHINLFLVFFWKIASLCTMLKNTRDRCQFSWVFYRLKEG